MKRFILILLLLLFISPLSLSAQSNINAGLVSGIWFSENQFFAGDIVRVYAAFQNHDGFDIEGTIALKVGEDLVTEKEFSVLSNRVIELWVDWEISEGDHSVSLVITKLLKSTPDGTEEIEVRNEVLATEEFFVDIDTDGDNIGNREDIDDDNDNIHDSEEEILGTDPLNPDSDGDGLLDDVDGSPLVAFIEEVIEETDNLAEEEGQTTTLEQSIKKTKEVLRTTKEATDTFSEELVQKIEKIHDNYEEKINLEDTTIIQNIVRYSLITLALVLSSGFARYLFYFLVIVTVLKIFAYLWVIWRNRQREDHY